MPSKKSPARKETPPAENLHIAAIQRIVGKHRNNLRMPLSDVRHWIERAAEDNGKSMESKDLERIRDQLQRDLGLEVGEVVQLVKGWHGMTSNSQPFPESGPSSIERRSQRSRMASSPDWLWIFVIVAVFFWLASES